MKNFLAEYAVLLSYTKDIILLMARWTIAYGFTLPALMKVQNLEAIGRWFADIGIPFASLMSVTVSSIETAGIILLVLGLFTRLISLLLACVMVGAIFFVHIGHGFSVANNGFEIPFYYLIFLMIFITFGPGKYSLDRLVFGEGRDA